MTLCLLQVLVSREIFRLLLKTMSHCSLEYLSVSFQTLCVINQCSFTLKDVSGEDWTRFGLQSCDVMLSLPFMQYVPCTYRPSRVFFLAGLFPWHLYFIGRYTLERCWADGERIRRDKGHAPGANTPEEKTLDVFSVSAQSWTPGVFVFMQPHGIIIKRPRQRPNPVQHRSTSREG